MKIKYFMLSLFLVVASYGFSFAAQPGFIVPVSVNNIPDPTRQSAGVEVAALVASSAPYLVVDTSSDTITDGFIHWVIRGSTENVSVGSGNPLYIELRGSTNTANVSSTRLIPRIYAVERSSNSLGLSPFIQFIPPIPFSTGLSVNLGPVGASGALDDANEFAIGVSWKKQ